MGKLVVYIKSTMLKLSRLLRLSKASWSRTCVFLLLPLLSMAVTVSCSPESALSSLGINDDDLKLSSIGMGNTGGLKKGIPGEIIFIFHESVTGFAVDDIKISGAGGFGAEKGALVMDPTDPEKYTFTVTPQAVGTLMITIPADSLKFKSGNYNTESSGDFTVK